MNKPNHYLIAIALSFVVSGIIEPLVSMNNQQGIVMGHILVLAILMFGWCKSHCKYSGFKEPKSSALMCGLLGIIGVSIYFFRVFGAKKGFLKTLFALVFVILCAVLYALATYMINYVVTLF